MQNKCFETNFISWWWGWWYKGWQIYTAGYFCVMMIVIEVADVQSPKVEAQSEEGQHSIRPDKHHHHQHCINIITWSLPFMIIISSTCTVYNVPMYNVPVYINIKESSSNQRANNCCIFAGLSYIYSLNGHLTWKSVYAESPLQRKSIPRAFSIYFCVLPQFYA